MKAEEIMRALHLTAMGRVNTPEQQRLCEALEKLMVKPDCDFCTMPGGTHYVYCPKNPTLEPDAPSVYGPADPTHSHAAAILSMESAPKRTRKKAD